jgi:hypothetical protein
VPVVATLSRLYDLDFVQGWARRTREESAGMTVQAAEAGSHQAACHRRAWAPVAD